MKVKDIKAVNITGLSSAILTAEQTAGMWLAKMLLWMLAGTILLYTLIFLFQGCGHCREPAISSTTTACKLCEAVTTKDNHTSMAFANLQFILNDLSPIFTTVLGYIFGTRARS